MTPEQVSALSGTQLNLKMVSIVFGKDWQKDNDLRKAYTSGKLNYLEDYNLTMPMAIKNQIDINCYKADIVASCSIGDKHLSVSYPHDNPLRAICECLVLIALADK